MIWLVSMLFGIQVLCSCTAVSPPREVAAALLSPRCDDPAVEHATDMALRQINADREEGYIFSLYRIFSAREQPQETTGSVFYLILDVVDTECPVLSRKLWKNCAHRPAHLAVYGQCKAIIYINQARNIAHLNTYECTLQPVPSRYIWSVCPDCPVNGNVSEPECIESALLCLAKFNEESEQTNYFSLLNVTRVSMQWVFGPAYFVEFLIQETSCSKKEKVADVSKCEPLPSDVAQIGFCHGSKVRSHLGESVSVSCEIFSQQDPATKEGKQEANQTPGKPSQDQEASASEDSFSSHLGKTVGSIKMLPPSDEDITFFSLKESQDREQDGKPVPPGAVGPTPSHVREKTQVKKPDLTKPVTEPVFLPFPEEVSASDSCPGEAKKMDGILHPLVIRKPTTA